MRGRTGTARGSSPSGARRRRARDAVTGKLRAHNPFELIRWLALSQPDPRKALAELVQNSLDAGARTIRVTRIREKGKPCLRVFDDGEGVIPEMERCEALRYVATHIGHSRKRSLSPEERFTLMTQGRYGIGLLGFWSLGQMLVMRTSVPGQSPHRLVLYRDRPDFLIEPLRGRLPLDERWTEVVVADLHRSVLSSLVGRRAADYLASELRGQLLARDVALTVEDRMSRGLARKTIAVRPPRFLGEQLEGIGPLEVPGYPPVRFEVYCSGEEGSLDSRGLAVYCAGTVVAGGFHELAPLGLDRPPWTDPRLTGMVDFPSLRVAPGSRRGIVVDEAAMAFARALAGIEPVLAGILDGFRRRRIEAIDRTLIRDLQRAFRDFYRQRPRFAMLPVGSEGDRAAGPAGGDGGRGGAVASGGQVSGGTRLSSDGEGPPGTDGEGAAEPPVPGPDLAETSYLLPPGPLAAVRIIPSPVRIECGGTRRVRARAFDAEGKAVEDQVDFRWTLAGPVGMLRSAGPAGPDTGRGEQIVLLAGSLPAEGTLFVVGRSAGEEARAEAAVEVMEELPSRTRSVEGIPEPEFVNEPGAPWRSRMLDDRWQVNSGHREYQIISDQATLKLRYLAMLFAKEVILRSYHDPRLDKPLEQLVEVSAYADRNLAGRRRRKRRRENP